MEHQAHTLTLWKSSPGSYNNVPLSHAFLPFYLAGSQAEAERSLDNVSMARNK